MINWTLLPCSEWWILCLIACKMICFAAYDMLQSYSYVAFLLVYMWTVFSMIPMKMKQMQACECPQHVQRHPLRHWTTKQAYPFQSKQQLLKRSFLPVACLDLGHSCAGILCRHPRASKHRCCQHAIVDLLIAHLLPKCAQQYRKLFIRPPCAHKRREMLQNDNYWNRWCIFFFSTSTMNRRI